MERVGGFYPILDISSRKDGQYRVQLYRGTFWVPVPRYFFLIFTVFLYRGTFYCILPDTLITTFLAIWSFLLCICSRLNSFYIALICWCMSFFVFFTTLNVTCSKRARWFGKKMATLLIVRHRWKFTWKKKEHVELQLFKGAQSCEVLAKELETINWLFGIENKIVSTTTDNGSNFVKAFNDYAEAAETVEEERSDEERSSCSGGIVDEDTIQSVRLLRIFGDNDEEGVEVFLPKHMRCASHTLSLAPLLTLARLWKNVLFTKSIIIRRLQRPKRSEINNSGAARRRMS